MPNTFQINSNALFTYGQNRDSSGEKILYARDSTALTKIMMSIYSEPVDKNNQFCNRK